MGANFQILLVPVMVAILIFVGSSYAQSNADPNREVYIFVQTFVRDSEGNLVNYFESDKFTDKNLAALNAFLDFEASLGSTNIYEIEGKKFQLIQRSKVLEIDSFQLVPSAKLADPENPINRDLLVRFAHDGYFVTPGDKLTQIWTFFRAI